jgi:hypothetical protein
VITSTFENVWDIGVCPGLSQERDPFRLKQVVGAFGGCEAVEQSAGASPGRFAGWFVVFAQQGLEFGEDLLDRVEVGRVGRRKKKLGTDAENEPTNGLAFLDHMSA